MKTFKDNEGREWRVEVRVDTIKRVRDLAGVDLVKITDGTLAEQLSDPVTLVSALYAVCKPQVDERKVTPEEFGESLWGDAIDEATTALMQGIVDFFPTARQTTLRKMLAKGNEVAAAATAMAEQLIEGLDVRSLLTRSASPTSSPASSASTPPDSPSES